MTTDRPAQHDRRRPRPKGGLGSVGGTPRARTPTDPIGPRDPFDLPGPFDPFDPPGPADPDDRIPPGPEMVQALDPDLPLVLLPVRLATRFHRTEPQADPTELWVRIFPDVLHADGHLPNLTDAEVTIGESYWERIWRAADGAAARLDAHAWLVSQIDAPRARWVAERTAPLNPGDAPASPTPAPAPLPRPLDHPTVERRTESRATIARLLPDRWCVIAREGQELVRRAWSRPVRRDLAMAPNLADLPESGDVRDLLRANDLVWMLDFQAAVRDGMAVRMQLPPLMREGIEQLLVFGVRADDADSPAEIDRLLTAHSFTEGLGILPQGTPTNNTVSVASAWSDEPADLEAYFGGIGAPPPPGPERQRIRGPLDISIPKPSIALSTAGDAVALTLGLEESGALGLLEHGDERHTAWPRAMNRIMWPASLGYMIRFQLGTDGAAPLDEREQVWLGDWFRNWVFGPGMLPALHVGEQPYGLLPVIRRPRSRGDIGSGDRAGLSSVLYDIEDAWSLQGGDAANFSPNRLDEPPTPEEEAVRLAAVLGAVPHPIDFRLRVATDERVALAADWAEAVYVLETELLPQGPNELSIEYYNDHLDDDLRTGGVQEQSSALYELRREADFRIDTLPAHADALREVIAHIDDVLLPMTTAHKLRSETRQWDDRFSDATLDDPDDPQLWYLEYGDDGSAADGTFPALRLVPDDLGQTATVQRLRALAEDAREISPFHRPAYLPGTEASLFIKLAEHAVMFVALGDAEKLAAAFDDMADLVEAADTSTVMSVLERTMRETLGLVGHRWDAWVTSLANERLSSMRQQRRTGVQVGGFGWLLDLVPDEGGNDSHGYIHAPSLDHAMTAAILRSAWLSYADEISDAPFSVDLSSDRVRRAMWLLDGVRNGLDLGELLGARFERRLHDLGLAGQIHEVRLLVLDAQGDAGTPAHAIVDGLELAVAYSPSTEDSPLRTEIDVLRATLPGYPHDSLLTALDATVADLDATADVLTAQAVHSVSKGKLAEAASVLSLSGSGASAVPEIRMPDVHRESRPIEHRVAAVLRVARASESLASIAEPSLWSWCDRLLPDVAASSFRVDFVDRSSWSGSLADAGLSAYDVIALSSVSGDLASGTLQPLVVARARFDVGASTARDAVVMPDRSGPSLHDIAVAAGAIRSAIGAARPLTARDLVDFGAITPLDAGELDTRRLAVAAALTSLLRHPGDVSLLTDRFADFVALDPAGLIAALNAAGDRQARTDELLATAASSLATLQAPFETDDPNDADDQIARIESALALTLPVLATFTPANDADLIAGFESNRVGSPMRAMSWLLQCGRVHAGTGRCATALDLAEVLRPDLDVSYQVAQFPDVDGAPWIALALPHDGARLAILSVTDAASALRAGPVTGLLFDSWTEPVPGRHATTGVAVHFDRPGCQPPQAALVAVVPEEGSWNVQEVEVVLEQTLEVARARAMGPETLRGWGHTLPAIHLGGSVAVSIRATESETETEGTRAAP